MRQFWTSWDNIWIKLILSLSRSVSVLLVKLQLDMKISRKVYEYSCLANQIDKTHCCSCWTCRQLNSYCKYLIILDCSEHLKKVSFKVQFWWYVLRSRCLIWFCNLTLVKRSCSVDIRLICWRNLQRFYDYIQKWIANFTSE